MRKALILVIMTLLFSSCVTVDTQTQRESIYAPIEQSLTNINQKVAAHLLVSGIPDGFNEVQYMDIIKDDCFPKPACRSQAEGIFSSFVIKARKVDGIFTVMLCDKDSKQKIMEDFSCNNLRVEVENWKDNHEAACIFEENWGSVKNQYCPN